MSPSFTKFFYSFLRAYKTIEEDDLKFPLIYGEGKKVGISFVSKELDCCIIFTTQFSPKLFGVFYFLHFIFFF